MFAGAASSKRVKGPQLPAEDPEMAKRYLGVVEKKLTVEEDQQRQEAIQDYMTEYNSHFRQKTLLEEHQDKARNKKGKDKRPHDQKLKDFMSRPFDREKDINYSGIDSQKAF